MERLFCLPNVQICADPAALNTINYITLFMPECSVLRKDSSLRVSRFKVNQDMMFVEDPPEFGEMLPDIRKDDVVMFSRLLLLVCYGTLSSFDKGLVWVATGFKCSMMCLCYFCFPFDTVSIVPTWCFKVLMTPSLCSSGWWELNSKNRSMCVGFLYSMLRLEKLCTSRDEISWVMFSLTMHIIYQSVWVLFQQHHCCAA